MDYRRPVEAVIPGASGRILAALARIDTELPVSTLANIARVGRTRASGIIGEMADLGIIERRGVGRTVLVSLARNSAAGELIDSLAHIQTVVVARLRLLAAEIDPAPESIVVFGSFARGEAGADSDIDVLAVRPPTADAERWAAALSRFADQARTLAGNPVQVLDYEVNDLRRRGGPKAKLARDFWDAARRDAIVLAGRTLDDLLSASR